MTVREASAADLPLLAPLFDAYRVFYRAASDPAGAERFLKARFERGESRILLAFEQDAAIGFTQLYPSFSSVSMAPIFVLNDLFVVPEARGRGAGAALLRAAAAFGLREGAVRLVLSTELANKTAQQVYERLGWKRNTVFCSYDLTLS